jgi:TonB family protein
MPLPRRLLLCLLVAAFNCLAQSPDSIKDPASLYATVARSYDFTNPTMQPWQLTATYQTFDPAGKPAESGTFHYWWLSPAVHRSTWTRGSAVQSEWLTADGRKLQTASGGPVHFFEINFVRELLSPLVDPNDPDLSDTYFERDTRTFGNVKAPCVKIVGKLTVHHTTPFPYAPPIDRVVSTVCFDPKLPVVVLSSSLVGHTYAYGDFVRTQDRYLPRSLVESINGRRLLTLSVQSVDSLNPRDPALAPPADAKPDTDAPVHLTRNDIISHRVGGSLGYPRSPNRAGIAGTVLLEFIITKDGHVRDPEPISSPDPSLTAAAISSISRWEFKPWVINGQPVEVRTEYEVKY